MAIARKHLIDDAIPGAYHLISRCVRRAYLCGDAAGHRRDWLAAGIERAGRCFAVDVLSFAVMDNHLHLVVTTHPDRAQQWTDREVATRWATLYPHHGPTGEDQAWNDQQIDALAGDSVRCHELRRRLASISWMMKTLKERVARRANHEDGCKGHFWEGRFRSVHLLDQAAILACMVYVDLNPIRARICDRPERSAYTAVRERIRARQAWRLAQAMPPAARDAAANALTGPEHGLWIAPIAECHLPGQPARALGPDDYIHLVDATGRAVRADKRGAIPADLLPILERLDIQVDDWIAAMRRGGRFIGAAIGHYAARAAEAARRGVRWIRNTLPELFGGRPPPEPGSG